NFDVIPEVRDRDPLWYNRDHNIAAPERPEHMHIHLPPPSYYPLIVASGMALLGVGLLAHLAVSVFGALVMIYGTWGWALEPTE
ncbi:MAG: cytochrome c oxidase subunit 4, partial [Dehalococcoidia bacterium]